MKKFLALALILVMVFALAACRRKDDPKPSGNTAEPGAQQTEPVTSEPNNNTDPGNNTGDKTIVDCNAYLEERSFVGFSFPEDLTVVDIELLDSPIEIAGLAKVTFCPVANDRYEAILQALFSETGMVAKNTSGETVTTLEEVLSPFSSDTAYQHGFYLVGADLTYSVNITYYPNGDGTNAAQTLRIEIEHGMKK